MLDLAKSLTSSLTTQLEDQARKIEELKLSHEDIQESVKALQSDGNQCSSHIQGSEAKFATLAHRVFQLEERANLDEVLYVFNTMVCNASISVLRGEIQAMKRQSKLGQETVDMVEEDDSMAAMDTIIGETNAILAESQAQVTNMQAQLKDVQSQMSRMREEFEQSMADLKRNFSKTSPEYGSPQNQTFDGPEISDNPPLETLLQRQEALETRMNALENLFFNQALEVTEKGPQKRANIDESEETQEMEQKEVEDTTESNKFQHLDLSALSRELLGLGERMKGIKDSIGVMNLPQTEAPSSRPCRAQDSARHMPGLDEWCRNSCSTGECPNNLCVCDS